LFRLVALRSKRFAAMWARAAGDLLQQAVHQDQHELHRRGACRARLEVDGVVVEIGLLVQGDLSSSLERSQSFDELKSASNMLWVWPIRDCRDCSALNWAR
jgi:hypothetical protein